MKSLIATIALCLTFGWANAQKVKEADVPEAVKKAFAAKYPGVKAEKWEMEEGNYEAEFDLKKIESSALFDAKGTFKELEQEIKTAELPKAISEYCTKNYAGWKLDEASKITDADSKITYEAEMEKGKEHFDAIFDSSGNFVKKEETKTDNDDDRKK